MDTKETIDRVQEAYRKRLVEALQIVINDEVCKCVVWHVHNSTKDQIYAQVRECEAYSTATLGLSEKIDTLTDLGVLDKSIDGRYNRSSLGNDLKPLVRGKQHR